MQDIVGAIFDDRAAFLSQSSGEQILSTSVVKVYRYPPDPTELANIQRYGSLMPESSARPRKRPLTMSNALPQRDQLVMASVEGVGEVRSDGSFTTPSKRRRIDGMRVEESSPFEPRRQGRSSIADQFRNSEERGTQRSIHQVYDSQTSPAKGSKSSALLSDPLVLTALAGSNPYRTPTSEPLAPPQQLQPPNQNDITSIPDSPSSTGAAISRDIDEVLADVNREKTKSESPEIRLSVHDVPPSEPQIVVQQPQTEIHAREISRSISPGAGSPSVASGEQARGGLFHESKGDGGPKVDHATTDNRTPILQSYKSIETPLHRIGREAISRRHTEQISDDIESDTESFCSKQQMHSVKRSNLNRLGSPRTLSSRSSRNVTRDRSDEPPVASEKVSSARRSRHLQGEFELGSLQSQQNVEPSNSGGAAANSRQVHQESGTQSVDFDAKQAALNGGSGESSQSQLPIDQDPALHGKLPSIETTSSVKVSDTSAKNWSDLDIEHPFKKALSQGRPPDLSQILSTSENHNVLEHVVDLQDIQGSGNETTELQRGHAPVERLAKQNAKTKEAAQQQDKERKPKETTSRSTIGHNRAGVEEGAPDEEPSDPEASEDRHLQKVQGSPSADHKHKLRTGTTADKHIPVEDSSPTLKDRSRKTPERVRRAKEKALSEQAEKSLLEADGAKQLQLETRGRQKKTPLKTPAKKTLKHPPRSEAQKAARKERDRKKREIQKRGTGEAEVKKTKPKAGGEAKATKDSMLVDLPVAQPNWARNLFETSDTPSNEARGSSEHTETDSERSSWSAKARSSGKGISKSNLRNVETPRRSMTPALPNTSATKSPSNKGSLKSSSPPVSRTSMNLNSPLRSALKQCQYPSASRRSVSFIDGQENEHRSSKATGNLDPAAGEPQPVKDIWEINNELALRARSPSVITSCSQRSEKTPSRATGEPGERKGMVQQKLNVTRDKKLKGRLVDPPLPTVSAYENFSKTSLEESPSISDVSSDEDFSNGRVKAGPSSKKRSPSMRSQSNASSTSRLHSPPIDPAIYTPKYANATKVCVPISTGLKSSPSTRTKSDRSSQSQALESKKADSVTSDSSAESESDLAPNAPSADPEPKTYLGNSTSSKGIQSPDSSSQKRKGDIKLEGQSPTGHQMSGGPTNPTYQPELRLDDGATEEGEVETRKSIPAQETTDTRSIKKEEAMKQTPLNSGWAFQPFLGSNRRMQYKYPTLTEQRRMAEATTAEEKANALAASRKPAVRIKKEDDSDSSSSSEESTSDSEREGDDGKGATAVSPSNSQASSKRESSWIQRSLMKRKRAQKVVTSLECTDVW